MFSFKPLDHQNFNNKLNMHWNSGLEMFRHEFLLNRVICHWNELTNSHVNAKIINSFKAGLDSLPILAAKASQAQ